MCSSDTVLYNNGSVGISEHMMDVSTISHTTSRFESIVNNCQSKRLSVEQEHEQCTHVTKARI